MSKHNVNAPFTGRWAPVPLKGLLELMKAKQYHAAVVWMVMLADAQPDPLWHTSRSIRSIHEETLMAHNTIKKARVTLIDAGFMSHVSGGRGTRKKLTFAMTRIATFDGKSGHSEQNNTPPKKPIGNW